MTCLPTTSVNCEVASAAWVKSMVVVLPGAMVTVRFSFQSGVGMDIMRDMGLAGGAGLTADT